MEVGSVSFWARTCALGFAVFFVSACSQSSSQKTETFHKTTAQCSSTAVAKQYVVRWKDGTTVVYKNTTEEQLLNDVVIPNESEIDVAEQDQKVRVAPPVSNAVTSEAFVAETSDWGQQITEASSAWAQGQKGSGVIVAVIDSGAQRNHPQLKNQMYVNAGESGTDSQGRDKSTNGVDDDGNGFVDDVSGYDFASNSGTVTDGSGHGTHVSGIIAADASQGSIKGIAPDAKILPLDFMTDDGSGNISDAIRAMYYAASQGAKVINASWGGAPCSATLQKAIQDIGSKGVLFVAAAGNSGVDVEEEPEYPAAFGLPTQITVGASTNRDYTAVFSNYSYTLVNLMAPGTNIMSTYPGSSTRSMNGTSMASPFVTGAAALLFSARPKATAEDVKSALLASVDAGPFPVSSRGRLNIRKALAEIQKLPQ
jgi:subtilisin family serine protease